MKKEREVNKEIEISMKECQDVINNWALSVFQRLQRENPEVLRTPLNNKEVKQYDQRRNKRISEKLAQKSS